MLQIEVAKQIDLIRPLQAMYDFLEGRAYSEERLQHMQAAEALTTARLFMIDIFHKYGIEMRDVISK